MPSINISNYAENVLLNFILTTEAVTRPTSWYLALFSDAAGLQNDEPTQEFSGGGYSRQSVSFGAAAGGSCTNSTMALFQAGATWPYANYLGIMNASLGGSLLFWTEFANKYELAPGDQIQFAINTIKVSMD